MNYQKLFNHMYEQHDMTMLESDMREIVLIVQQMIEDEQPDEPQPKTIREWFEELPEPYRSDAIKNISEPDRITEDMIKALYYGLNFRMAGMDTEVWNKYFADLCDQKNK